ncbi:MAG TPA: hypothetical protein VGN20_26485 [Mucilaginibacter sp.]|jgi:hypothetical protein
MKRNMIFLVTLPVLIPGQLIARPAIANQTEDSSTGLIVVLALGLLILVVLTLWLLKSSYSLTETVENSETNGKVWLTNHLKDLDHHQLDILIKRHSLMSNQPLKDEKPHK